MKKPIETLTLNVRGQKVILDTDLAELYGVETGAFNQAIKRNADRFPEDFMFQLTAREWGNLKSQIVISSLEVTQTEGVTPDRSQIATSSHGGRRRPPHAFTEHGALMAANVLHSKRAVEMSVFVIRAFVRIREHLVANAAILKRLAEIDKTLLEHDSGLRTIWTKLQPLLAPPPEPTPRRIKGFNPDDE
jgi:hypothetical protein